MTIQMNDSHLNSLKEIKDFLNSSKSFEFKKKERKETYQWIEKTLIKFEYLLLSKHERGIIKKYIEKITGYSRAQVTRLIAKHKKEGYVRLKEYKRNKFKRRYPDSDIYLLAKTDEIHEFPNGAALKKILQRLVNIYKRKEYESISKISVGHIYNLRESVPYRRITKRYKKTKPHVVNIGERRRPNPQGKPGFLRVDTAHQGDREGEKGVYHINSVDEVTQSEVIGATEKISERFLAPLLLKLLNFYPFKILEFHPDNGSEYINRVIVEMLNKLLIKLTKSRKRKPNDNALVESKHGSIIRKWIGYGFIEQKHAERINKFYFGCFNEYLNFHRPCAFATEIKDKKGKIKKIYKHKDYMTPYEKLKTIPNSEKYLKEGITFKMLDKIAKRKSDNEMAEIVQKERDKLFEDIKGAMPSYSFRKS